MRWCRMAHIVGRGDGLSKSRFIRERLFVWCVCGGGGGGGAFVCVKKVLQEQTCPKIFFHDCRVILR